MSKGIVYNLRRKVQVAGYKIMGQEFMSKAYFFITFRKRLNLKAPKSFNEKLQWLKLHYWPDNKLAIQCADKYEVRKYLESKGMSEYLNELYGVWTDANDIDFSKLPNKFVLKCNHGCGYNIICKDKTKLDIEETRKKLNTWLKEDFGKFNAEPHYTKIEPKIICEKFLEGEIINYNIYVFNGKAVFLSVAGGLGDGSGEHLTYYWANGDIANFTNKNYPINKNNKLTPLLPKMVKTAEELAENLPMVRVDLFDIDGKIVLSEMTFTPGGALIPIKPYEMDVKLGEKLNIEKEMKKWNKIK